MTAQLWSRRRWAARLAALSLATLLIHGFHPFAEDGGLYAAGVEYTLDHSLFPHGTAFVTEHLRFSLFAPPIAFLVRGMHLPLPAVLLLLDLLAALATLLGARAVLRRCFAEERAQLAGLALLAAGWSLPVAGTSLYLMDPYVTARSVSVPLALFGMAFALEPWPGFRVEHSLLRHPAARCGACLLVAAAFHPLMAAYALLFVIALRATSSTGTGKIATAWLLLALSLGLLCVVVNTLAPAESPAEHLAILSRYYWFLSQWQWYERLGLLGPVVVFALLLPPLCRVRLAPEQIRRRILVLASLLLGLQCTAVALLFAHESASSHAVARLQPLRGFLLLYAVMLLLLGATVYSACMRAAQTGHTVRQACLRALPVLFTTGMATGLFLAARATYPDSPHLELPWQPASAANAWVQAFLWARTNTPRDALFALDAKYVNTDGEDAQCFRAISLRSALPDYSKDGGEASIAPALAPAWLAGADAQNGLSDLDDTIRDRRLQPSAVTWMVLHATARTRHACPYRNAVVEVCRLQP